MALGGNYFSPPLYDNAYKHLFFVLIMSECKICGEEDCKEHSYLIYGARKIDSFSGSSPPEIFVGRWNYPNVYTGILSPQEYGNTEIMSSPEEWHKNNLSIPSILELRKKLIYGRSESNVKKPLVPSRFLSTMQEVAMTSKSISAEFLLKNSILPNRENDSRVPLISRAASVQSVRLQENTKIEKKVDYLVNDSDVKSADALFELEKSGIANESMVKILSAGLLGLKRNRKLVPTRWSITAVDDTLSKNKLEKIRYYNEIQQVQVFFSEYLGNHYEFILVPSKWEFEVIELSMKNFSVWYDYESFFPRKKYADSVTGAYYANRLAVSEYLDKIKRQGACIVLREIRPEYYAPLGVGILRECSRGAFSKKPEVFDNIKDALECVRKRLRVDVNYFKEKSKIIKNYGKQRKISEYF